MDPMQPEFCGKQEELHAKRKELHGKRRKLNERLSEVCEEFVLSDMCEGAQAKSSGERITVFARLLQG